MAYLDFMSAVHKSTTRDYLARVNDPEFPKHKAAGLAKEWGYDYWDGDRRINYGGYRYLEGRWEKVAHAMQKHYQLPKNAKILDVGCGKGFMLYDFTKVLPDAEVQGIDISSYAIENSKPEVRMHLVEGRAESLPWPDDYFDLVYSLNTFHNLHTYELEPALREFERVGKQHKYICVESYRVGMVVQSHRL
jgi:SAM-dependent methyltransferase